MLMTIGRRSGQRPSAREREEPVTRNLKLARSAGVLLHPTSLPGPYGIGDLGPTAFEWIEVLAGAGQKWWQILPLGPTGYGDSPYQSFSAFAGNINLLSPEVLVQDGLLHDSDLPTPNFPAEHIDYGPVIEFKKGLLGRAWENFQGGAAPTLRSAFDAFCNRQSSWLDDFSLFMALKEAHKGASWHSWAPDLVLRKPAALEKARRSLAGAVNRQKFGQFLFARQWGDVKQHAQQHGLKLIGDVPIFVSVDSSDVWANPDLFILDEQRNPTVVAGVPPDYFSPTGQLWGNPHYDWPRMKQTGYAWWIARLKATLNQVDLVRLDHFRGFEAYWEIPAENTTAENGQWVPGPGADLLGALRSALDGLPLIAEDLGVITAEVEALRDQFELPGMRILQFAFSGPDNRFLPHHYEPNTVVYTGTHDNDTTVGWYSELPANERRFLDRYLPGAGKDIAWELLRLAWGSVANLALAPLQDLLSLPSETRMNFPGRPAGNWCWRFHTGQVSRDLLDRLAELTATYSR
jgi:4-alpha-glucanotransferase